MQISCDDSASSCEVEVGFTGTEREQFSRQLSVGLSRLGFVDFAVGRGFAAGGTSRSRGIFVRSSDVCFWTYRSGGSAATGGDSADASTSSIYLFSQSIDSDVIR